MSQKLTLKPVRFGTLPPSFKQGRPSEDSSLITQVNTIKDFTVMHITMLIQSILLMLAGYMCDTATETVFSRLLNHLLEAALDKDREWKLDCPYAHLTSDHFLYELPKEPKLVPGPSNADPKPKTYVPGIFGMARNLLFAHYENRQAVSKLSVDELREQIANGKFGLPNCRKNLSKQIESVTGIKNFMNIAICADSPYTNLGHGLSKISLGIELETVARYNTDELALVKLYLITHVALLRQETWLVERLYMIQNYVELLGLINLHISCDFFGRIYNPPQ